MIEIKKGREPDKLLRYRQQDDASYEQMDKEVKEELLEKLLEEQGHICAYCMRRIPEKRALPNGVPPVTIEHWYPRNPESKEDIGQDLNYRNMFAVCSGNRGCGNKEGMTCDARRGNEPIKINPCNADTLRGITYTSSGRIQSSDPEIDEDINERLNLNSESISLPENRKQVLQALIAYSAKSAHPFRRNGAPFRLKLSKAQPGL
jgi:uncharacterized protein (TIGR02646 family)